MAWSDYESPFGRLTVVASERGLRELHFPGRAPELSPCERDPESLRAVCEQLDEHFGGGGESFEIARAIGATPTPIVIPCHRVMAADGSLTGHRGGLQRKRALVNFETAGAARTDFWSLGPRP